MPHIRLTTFRWVPNFAQGLVKDLRVRWALEEAGLPTRKSSSTWVNTIRPHTAHCSPSARYRCTKRMG